MKLLGQLMYWLICISVIFNLLFLNDWLMFIDPISLITVIVPTIAALFITPNASINQKLTTSLKVCWVSGGLMFLYSVILTFSYGNQDNDVQVILAGLAIAFLPILYCFIISLLYAPYVFDKTWFICGKENS